LPAFWALTVLAETFPLVELVELPDGEAFALEDLVLVVVVEVGVLVVAGLEILDVVVVVEDAGAVVVVVAAGVVVVAVLLTATLLTTEVAVVVAF